MTSTNGNIFRVTGPLCGESTGHRWIPLTKSKWRGALMFSFICAGTNGWVNNREAGDLRRHRAHYDVIVMSLGDVGPRSRVQKEPRKLKTLLWRHNENDSVSYHQPRGCLLNRLFIRRSKKTSKLRVTGLCVGNSPGPVNSPHNGPVTRKMFPFDDVIMNDVAISLDQNF